MRVKIALVLFLAIAPLPGCKKKSAAPEPPPEARGTRQPISTAMPAMPAMAPRRPLGVGIVIGTVVPSRQVSISPPVSGRIVKIHAKLGDYVEAKAPLVTQDAKDYDLGLYRAGAGAQVAKANLQLARTHQAHAWKELQRAKQLHESKTIPDVAWDKIKMAYQIAKGRTELAKKQLTLSRAGLSTAYKARQDVITRAPFGGFITRILMFEGDYVRSMPPSTVLRFADVTPVYVEASIGELALPRLPAPGEPIRLVVPALGNKVLTVKMTGKTILPALNPATRSATLRIPVANADHALKLGLSVEIHLGPTKK